MTQVSTLLTRLRAIRRSYAPGAAAEKLSMLQQIESTHIGRARQLRELHEDLLFLLAFPDSPEVHAASARLLKAFRHRIARLARRNAATLDDSGMPGTTSRHVFVYGIARWLAARYPGTVALDWPAVQDRAALDALLARFMTPVESDAAESDAINTREWLRVASRAGGNRSSLAWVLRELMSGLDERQAEVAYDFGSVPVRWRITGPAADGVARSLVDGGVQFRTGMRTTPKRPRAVVAAPAAGIRLLAPDDADRVIDAARSALTARCREVHAVSYANRDETWMADLGEGAALAIIGVEPARRMGLEANYGYTLFSNGVAVGYGGVSPLFFDANTGINIFDAFRGSEAGFLWAAMLRAFRTLFGTTRFIVNAYQFGEGNEEAIASGAFWFYYRLGFRPAKAETRLLARQEFVQMEADRGYRSSKSTLRALATGDLHLELPGFRRERVFEEQWLGTLAMAVARRIASEHPDRDVAVRRIAASVARQLDAGSRSGWPAGEQRAFTSMAPLAALAPDLERWSAATRRSLVATMRAKGGARERDYVTLAQRNHRFIQALRGAVDSGSSA